MALGLTRRTSRVERRLTSHRAAAAGAGAVARLEQAAGAVVALAVTPRLQRCFAN